MASPTISASAPRLKYQIPTAPCILGCAHPGLLLKMLAVVFQHCLCLHPYVLMSLLCGRNPNAVVTSAELLPRHFMYPWKLMEYVYIHQHPLFHCTLTSYYTQQSPPNPYTKTHSGCTSLTRSNTFRTQITHTMPYSHMTATDTGLISNITHQIDLDTPIRQLVW